MQLGPSDGGLFALWGDDLNGGLLAVDILNDLLDVCP